MSDAPTPPARKRSGQKKWPLRGAAKFREETPRKGGGLAIKDRDTALQQYEEKPLFVQAQKGDFSKKLFRGKAGKISKSSALFFITCCVVQHLCNAKILF